MAALNDVLKDGFSFTWTIQNFSYCSGDSVTSPTFMTETLGRKLMWCLVLYPKRIGVSFTTSLYLTLVTHFGDTHKLEASFELSIYTPTGTFKQEDEHTHNFGYLCGRQHGIHSTIRLEDLFKKESNIDINNHSLTVRCKILKVNKMIVAFADCHARTIMVIERVSFVWNILNFLEGFNTIRLKKEPAIFLEKSTFTMEITSSGGGFAEEKIIIEIKPMDSVKKYYLFSTCEMSLISIDGKKVYSVRDEHMFNSESKQVWKVSLIPMDKLLGRKELYLRNGTLILLCEFAVSSGATYHEVKTNDIEIKDLSLLEDCKQEKDVDVSKSLNYNLKCLYTKERFTDLKIQTRNKEFPVHKTILCARSEVFSAMFESETKEKLTGVVEIKDIDDDTISKMLLFMYTDSVGEELDFQMAFRLYSAADKYGIVVLKEKCATLLRNNFTMTSVCDVLILADMHEGQELKTDAQNFIFENRSEMMGSEEWDKLMQNHLQLASETMRSFLLKL